MDLILADSLILVQKSDGDHICCSVPEMPRQSYAVVSGDKRKFDMESEFLANWPPATIKLFLKLTDYRTVERIPCRMLELRLVQDSSHRESIFKRLWNRFQSEVVVSVNIQYDVCKGQFVDMAVYEGLLINEESFECSGSALSLLYHVAPQTKIRAKIVAHLPVFTTSSEVEALPNKTILEEGFFSDVTIVAANGAEIKAHKNFLAARSPVLMATFKNEMQESATGRLDMTDVSEPGIVAFLRYLYCGDLKGPSGDVGIAFQVLYAAHKYHVRCLEAEAAKCLTKRKNADFSLGQAYKIYMFARNVESLVELKEKAIKILKSKLDGPESLEGFQNESSFDRTILEVIMDFSKTSPS